MKTSPQVLRDRIANVEPEQVAQCALKILSEIQDRPADRQLAAVTALFITLGREAGMDLSDLYRMVDSVMHSGDNHIEFTALRSYARDEVLSQQ